MVYVEYGLKKKILTFHNMDKPGEHYAKGHKPAVHACTCTCTQILHDSIDQIPPIAKFLKKKKKVEWSSLEPEGKAEWEVSI